MNFSSILLSIIFHIGIFVSKKVIPQLSDTGEVIDSLDLSNKKSELLVIIANIKGAEITSYYNQISYVGFPFSISENFQMRNTNKTINESFTSLVEINKIVSASQKKLVQLIFFQVRKVLEKRLFQLNLLS